MVPKGQTRVLFGNLLCEHQLSGPYTHKKGLFLYMRLSRRKVPTYAHLCLFGITLFTCVRWVCSIWFCFQCLRFVGCSVHGLVRQGLPLIFITLELLLPARMAEAKQTYYFFYCTVDPLIGAHTREDEPSSTSILTRPARLGSMLALELPYGS